MDTTLKWKPLAAEIPLRIGLYESPEFRQYVGESHVERFTILLPIGESSSWLINPVLSAMFAEVVRLDHWPPERELTLLLGISPEIRGAEPVFRVQVVYGFTLYCSRLASESSWTVKAAGLTGGSFTWEDLTSTIWAKYGSAASAAVRNAMAAFMIGFRDEAAVRECLAAEGIETEESDGADQ